MDRNLSVLHRLRSWRLGVIAFGIGAALIILVVAGKRLGDEDAKGVLILGDSFVEGEGATAMQGWAQRLAASFDDAVVSGAGGDTIESLSQRLDPELSDDYEIVLVEIGINDSRIRRSLGHNEVLPRVFREGLRRVLERLAAHTDRLGVLGLTRVDETKTSPYRKDKFYVNKAIAAYDAMLREIAVSRGVSYIRVPTLLEEPDLLLDGLHPSDRGHAELLSAVSEQIAAWRADLR